ncbi:MAG TPA: YdcF family protein [Treponemataceae bacterium]|nr:YdcF family protein [Treponemataceae bacterium]HPS44084.1 YdcF family protein [Treponemataceae bacterium]
MKKPISVAWAAAGTAAIAYYAALLLSDPENLSDFSLDFSLVWAFFGLAAWAIAIRGDAIASTLKKIFFRTKARSIATVAAASLFLAVSASFLTLIFIPFSPAPAPKAEYLIVLGGGIRRDGSASAVLIRRLDRAVDAYRENPVLTLVVTGGKLKKEPWPEAETMARYLEEKEAIPETAVIREPEARDTIQNFSRSLALIRADAATREPTRSLEADPPRIAVLTSGFHMNRALFLAQRSGFAPVGAVRAPCPTLYAPNAYLREVGAYWKLAIRLAARAIVGP